MVSGKSHIGYLNNNPYNPYVDRPVILSPHHFANVLWQEPVVYDFIVVKNFKEVDLEDNSEGELDGESDEEDEDMMVIDL